MYPAVLSNFSNSPQAWKDVGHTHALLWLSILHYQHFFFTTLDITIIFYMEKVHRTHKCLVLIQSVPKGETRQAYIIMSFKSVEWGCNESFRECIQYVLYTCNIYVRYSVILENIGLLNPTGWCFSCLVDMSSYFRNLFCASSLLFLSVVFIVTKCQSPFRWCGRIQKLNCSHAAPISTIFLFLRSCLWLFAAIMQLRRWE